MATIKPSSEATAKQNDYYLLRRAQAVIAAYQHFGNGDLSKYLIEPHSTLSLRN